MAKFKYRMQNILDIKEKLETQAKVEFGLKNRAYLDEQQVLQEYVVRRVGYEKHLKDTMQGDLDLKEVGHARSDVTNMKTIVRRQMMEVHKAEKELEDARAKLNEVRKERKIQEKLKEKAFDEFKQELADAETKEVDELVSYTHNHVDKDE
jgi:flagellar FliJ protein